ncbi:MAG: hypothetical protein QXR45_13475 [Candidatus Bathyarchaeia archaeon]
MFMWKVWKSKNLDLENLATKIVDFFEKEGCVCAFSRIFGKFRIYVKLLRLKNTAIVTISGSPECFKVEFVWRRNLLQYFTNFASLFGGGFFVSKATTKVEYNALDQFEDQFWTFVENVITMLSE